MAMMNNWNATNAAQAQTHHCAPPACISHNTSQIMGTPKARPSTRPLSASLSHKRQVILLKPKRASITKVWYSDKGRPIKPEMNEKPKTKAICCVKPEPSQASKTVFKASRPPSKVQAKRQAASMAMSSCETRILARV